METTKMKSTKAKNSTQSTKDNPTTTAKTKDAVKIEKTKTDLSEILKPTAKGRISKLDTLNILADKHKMVSKKYDELTHFVASNDGTSGSMKFTSDGDYTFSIKNPAIINEILDLVERKLAEIVENTEKEVLAF